MTPGQGSSIVNTAEAIYVLTRSGMYLDDISCGLRFINDRLFSSIEKQGPRTRYVIFALLAALDHLDKVKTEFIERSLGWLLAARNNDGGWGHLASDGYSQLFPTCMSMLMMNRLEVPVEQLQASYNWIKSKSGPSGWAFDGSLISSPVSTVLAVLALRQTKEPTDETFVKPKELLLATTHWGNERENLPGTLWDHCSYMWIFPALIALGVEPYAPTIAEGVRAINRLGTANGWTEPSGGESIRGQFWVVLALDAIKEAFDPSIHPYRIDSEKSQRALSEPEFVNVAVHSRWAIIVPRRLYQVLAYILVAVLFTTFTGIYRLLPRSVDFIISIVLGIGVYS